MSGPPGWVVWSRPDCGLCEEFVAELAPLLAAHGQSFEVRDVDDDPERRRRFGLKIPVLTLDGRLVASGRLEPQRLADLLARRR